MADPLIGTMLGRYRILSSIGSGGMGDVYLAFDTTLRFDLRREADPEESVAQRTLAAVPPGWPSATISEP